MSHQTFQICLDRGGNHSRTVLRRLRRATFRFPNHAAHRLSIGLHRRFDRRELTFLCQTSCCHSSCRYRSCHRDRSYDHGHYAHRWPNSRHIACHLSRLASPDRGAEIRSTGPHKRRHPRHQSTLDASPANSFKLAFVHLQHLHT